MTTIKKINKTKIATSLTIATFFSSCLSGLFIFFEIEINGIRPTHEWFSILFLLSAIFHVYTHKTPFINYFKNLKTRKIIYSLAMLSFVFLLANNNDVYIAQHSYDLLVKGPIRNIAPIVKKSNIEIKSNLNTIGIKNVNMDMSVSEIATAYDLEEHHVLETILLK